MAGPRRVNITMPNHNNSTTTTNTSWWEEDPPTHSETDEDEDVEVTYQQQHSNNKKPPSIPGRRLLQSLRSAHHSRQNNNNNNNNTGSPTKRDEENDNWSTTDADGNNAAFTVASNDDTVLVSNRKKLEKSKAGGSSGSTKPWKTLKRFVTSKKGSSHHNTGDAWKKGASTHGTDHVLATAPLRERARSERGPISVDDVEDSPEVKTRKRFDSEPSRFTLKRLDTEPVKSLLGGKGASKKKQQQQQAQQQEQEQQQLFQSQLDSAIRGRLDGMDVLSLGTARHVLHGTSMTNHVLQQPISYSLKRTPHHIVSDMLWTSGGKDRAEMVLEGFIPAGGDRWMVCMEEGQRPAGSPKSSPRHPQKRPFSESKSSSSSSPIQSLASSGSGNLSSCGSGLCGSASSDGNTSPPTVRKSFDFLDANPTQDDTEDSTPIHVLLQSMWGSNPPPPTHASRNETAEEKEEDADAASDVDNILQLAASCNVPIDIDEDTFMIDTAAHLQAVHDILSEPLKHARYEDALEMFRKIVKGLQQSDGGRKRPLHLIGSTLHNMGVVYTWQANYTQALECLEQAVTAREERLPKNHVDIAVSLMREGVALLALESFDSAKGSFQRALDICTAKPNTPLTRAKLLNNLGVAHFLKRDLVEALVAFTGALEIQRKWLDGPVRRTSIVFDASVTLGNMGKVYLERKDYDTALYVYEEALLLQTASFRKDHDIVVASLGNLAYAKAMQGDTLKALQIYKGVLRSQELKYGKTSREAVETLGLIGLLHAQNENYKDALQCLARVYKWQQLNLNAYNPAVKNIRNTMKRMERSVQSEASAWI